MVSIYIYIFLIVSLTFTSVSRPFFRFSFLFLFLSLSFLYFFLLFFFLIFVFLFFFLSFFHSLFFLSILFLSLSSLCIDLPLSLSLSVSMSPFVNVFPIHFHCLNVSEVLIMSCICDDNCLTLNLSHGCCWFSLYIHNVFSLNFLSLLCSSLSHTACARNSTSVFFPLSGG